MPIKDMYQGYIREIMAEYGIEPAEFRSDHVVMADTGFAEAIRHTDWYIAGRGDSMPHYRYRRYTEALNRVSASSRRESHVDIGCGAGLFSWVFLDWAKRQDLAYNRIDLYGLDHCPDMIRLANMVKNRLAQNIGDYPDLRYYSDIGALLRNLTNNHQANTDYTITFGHVLVQANTQDNIRNFAHIITHILNLINAGCNCALWAIDARSRSAEFTIAWNSLLGNLSQAGVSYEELNIQSTLINDSGSAKAAFLHFIN